MKKLILASLAAVTVFALAGCNTAKGVGKDIQAGGRVLENAADDVQESIKKDKKAD